jgi:hypothetical protein
MESGTSPSDNPAVALVWRSLGVVLVLRALVVLAWCVGVALSDEWNTNVEPMHVLLVALVGLGSGALGVVGARDRAMQPVGIGLLLAVASFFGVVLIIGGT